MALVTRLRPAAAQSLGELWTPPTNLSQSGAASDPVIVQGPRGTLQVIWWDDFDGLTTAVYNGASWSDPVIAPIVMTGEEGAYWIIWEQKPSIIADDDGIVHALWQDKGSEYRPEIKRILHSELRLGTSSWSAPDVPANAVLTFATAVDPGDGVLLVYIRNEQTSQLPAGVYYRRLDGQDTADLLYETRYFRGVQPDEVYMDITVTDDGDFFVVWDDPREERSLYVVSRDGGRSWTNVQGVEDPDGRAVRLRFLPGPNGELLRVWQDPDATCAIYQQVSIDGGRTWSERQRILEDLRVCPDELKTLRTSDGSVFLVGGTGSNTLYLAAWGRTSESGESYQPAGAWSRVQTIAFSFEDLSVGRRVTLDKLRVVMSSDDRLSVTGFGQDGEVWFTQGMLNAVEWAFADPSPWSSPINVSQGEMLPDVPAVAADREGRVHLVWSALSEDGIPSTVLYYSRSDDSQALTQSEVGWTRPAEILSSAGVAHQPAIVTVGDRIHTVWSGGESGQIYYSRAYVRDAYVSGGWSAPVALLAGGMTGSSPQIAADLRGGLHVVYAVPVNTGRGLYYVYSEDGGVTWSEPAIIFDAAAADWASVDHPALAVDGRRGLHVAWVRSALLGKGLPSGIVYSHTTGDVATGEVLSWSKPYELAPAGNDWPVLVTTYTGQIHALWHEVTGAMGWYHRWSGDAGMTWSLRARVSGLDGVPGPLQMAADGTGAVHLVGLGKDDAAHPALLHIVWQGGEWGELERTEMPVGFRNGEGTSLTIEPLLGQLYTAIRGSLLNSEGTSQDDIFALQRLIPAVAALPEPAFTPPPTATPTPGPTPVPTPTPRPTVNSVAPAVSPPTVGVGPLTLPLVAIGGILAAAAVVLGAVAVKGRRR